MTSLYIQELHIYGYGKFENYVMKDIQQLQVIYGENEAGKSTLMSFIQSILFGFPLKQQSELRYEPKNHSKYGGRIIIMDEKFGRVDIERVKGKAAGDVTVTLEDGTRGGDELLNRILKSLDKNQFQSIYSFNIHGLQNVQKLKGEDISKFLFSASAIGSEKIMEAENLLEKEMEKLFKPNGSKPELNQQLASLKEIELKLNQAKQKNSSYQSLLNELDYVEEQIRTVHTQIGKIDQEISRKREWNRIYPQFVKRDQYTSQLKELSKLEFPSGGVATLKQLDSELKTIQKRLLPINHKQEQLEKEIEAVQVNLDFINHKDELQLIVDEMPETRHDEEAYKEISIQLIQLEEEIISLSEKVGMRNVSKIVQELDLSFAKKDLVTKLVQNKRQLAEKKRELQKRDEEIRLQLQSIQNLMKELQTKSLDKAEKKSLLNLIKTEDERSSLIKQQQLINEQLGIYEKSQQNNKNNTKKIGIISFILCVAMGIAFFILDWVQLAIGLFVGSILLLVIILMNQKQESTQSENNIVLKLLKQKEIIETKLSQITGSDADIKSAKLKLEQDNYLLRQQEIEQIKLNQLESQFNSIVNEFEAWELASKENETQLLQQGMQLNLNSEMAKNYLLEAFEYLENINEKQKESVRLRERLSLIQKRIIKRQQNLSNWEDKLQLKGSNYQEKVTFLKSQLSIQQELFKEIEEKRRQLSDVEEQIEAWKLEEQSVRDSIRDLLDAADASNIEEFLEKGDQIEKRNQLQKQLSMVEEQLLSTSIPIADLLDLYSGYIGDIEFEELEAGKTELKRKGAELESQKAAISYEISILEDGGSYSELLHQFHQKKYELNQEAKRWAVFSTAKFILEKALSKYKTDKLPELLKKASILFEIITHGNYHQIFTDTESDQIFVVDKSGMIFLPEELSQATHEQLYMSIRFSLADTLYKDAHIPLIIDDGFVHFDAHRLETVLKVLKELARNRQILLFTCHSEIKNHFVEQTTAVHSL